MNMAMMAGLEMPEGVVQLNVGGTIYLTTYDTLQRDPHSLLAQLLNPEGLEANSKVGKREFILFGISAIVFRWPNGWPTARSSLTGMAICLPTSSTICAVGNCCCPKTFGNWRVLGRRLAALMRMGKIAIGQVQFYQLDELYNQLIPYYNLKVKTKQIHLVIMCLSS